MHCVNKLGFVNKNFVNWNLYTDVHNCGIFGILELHYSGIVWFLERIVYTVLMIMMVARMVAVKTKDKIGINKLDPPDVCSWDEISPAK